MNFYLKLILMFLAMVVIGYGIYQMVIVVSPATDLFAPR